MAPASFLLLFLLRKDWKTLLLKTEPFVRFCTLMLFFNALPYWLSPGTRMRYVYMLYPLAGLILAWVYLQRNTAPAWTERVFKLLVLGLLLILALGAWALPHLPELQFMRSEAWGWAAVTSLGIGLSWIVLYQQRRFYLPILLLTFTLIRVVFDGTVLPQRAHESGAQRDRALAYQIDQIVGDAPLYTAFQEKVVAYTTIVYLNRLRPKVVRRKDQLRPGAYYLVPLHRAPKNVTILLTTEYGGHLKALIKT
jgi:hypothetical protein